MTEKLGVGLIVVTCNILYTWLPQGGGPPQPRGANRPRDGAEDPAYPPRSSARRSEALRAGGRALIGGHEITGHKTESVYTQYAIVPDVEQREALAKV